MVEGGGGTAQVGVPVSEAEDLEALPPHTETEALRFDRLAHKNV